MDTPDTEKTLRKPLFERAVDGCHRYGWVITIAVYIVTMAYYMGGLTNEINGLKDRAFDNNLRIGRIEQILMNR